MFNLSPSQQFMLARGLQQASGQQPITPGSGFVNALSAMLNKPQGLQVAPQSMAPQAALPQGQNAPGIMNRFRSMVSNRLPPQMNTMAAANMMPPQG